MCLVAVTAYSLASDEQDYSNPELATLLAARFPLMAALMGRTPSQPAYPVPIIVPLPLASEYAFLGSFFCKKKHKDEKEEVPEIEEEEDYDDNGEDGEYPEEEGPLHPLYPFPPPPPYHPPANKPKPTTTAKPVKTTTAKPVKTTTAKPVKTTTAKPVKTTTAKPVKTTTKPPKTTTKKPTTTTACPTHHHPDDHDEDHHHHEHPVEEELYPPGYPSHPPGYPVVQHPQTTTTPTTTTSTTTTAKPKPTKPAWWDMIFSKPKPKSVKSPSNNLRKSDPREEITHTVAPVEVEEPEEKGDQIETTDLGERNAPEETAPRGEELVENP